MKSRHGSMAGQQKYPRPAGFTLTEVVVVMAITSTLLALLMPALGRGRDLARTVKGLSNQKELVQGIHAYSFTNRGTLPFGFNLDYLSDNGGTGSDWAVMVNSLITGQIDTYWAPSDPDPVLTELFIDPNASWPQLGTQHYSGHPILMPTITLVNNGSRVPGYTPPPLYKTSRIRRSSEILLLTDGMQNPPGVPDIDQQGNAAATAYAINAGAIDPETPSTYTFVLSDSTIDDPILPGDNLEDSAYKGDIRWRQLNNTAANFVFADGHGETLKNADANGNCEVLKRNILVD